MLLEVAKASEIAPGGMKFVKAGDREIVVCNCDGHYYAVDRRCGHMNGPLEMGALDGTILTCPMHHVQFDVTTGQALSQPVPAFIDEPYRADGHSTWRTSACSWSTRACAT